MATGSKCCDAPRERLIQLESDLQPPASIKQEEFLSRSSILNRLRRPGGRTFPSETANLLTRASLAWLGLAALLIVIPPSQSSSLTATAEAAAASVAAQERHRTHSSELSTGRHHRKSTHGQLHSNQTPAGVWRRASEYLSETPTPTDQWPAPHTNQKVGSAWRQRWRRRRRQGAHLGDIGVDRLEAAPDKPIEDEAIKDYQDRWGVIKLKGAQHQLAGRNRAQHRLAPATDDIRNVFVSRDARYAIIDAAKRRQLRASDGGTSTQPPSGATANDFNPPNDGSDDNDDPTDEADEHWTESSSAAQTSSLPNNTGDAPDTGEACETIDAILATRPSPWVGWVFGFNYSIIFVFGLLGNVITLYVLLCKGKKCSAQDILIANLACSDIMLCVFAVPITPKYLILDGHWTLGQVFCKVVSFAQSTSVYMSTYSLICIGYIRYRLIVHPLEESMSKRTALFSCLGTWGVSLLVTLPYMLQVRLSPENCDIKFCDEAWEKPSLRFAFSLFTTFFQFIIPLGSVGFFNKKIYSRLDGRRLGGGGHQADHKTASAGSNSHASGKSGPRLAASGEQGVGTPKQRPSNAHAPSGIHNVLAIKEQRQRDKEKRMRKANNRLIFVVVIFAHSWLPLNLFNLAQDYFEAISNWPYLTFTFLVVHQVACSSVCWNPILYAWMSETYRQDLRIALPKFIASRLVSCLTDPSSLHSTGGAHSHHAANTAASNLAHSQHSLVRVNHSVGSTSGFGLVATKAVSANSSLAPVSLPALPIAQSQTSCDELCELPSGTAPSSSCCPCSLHDQELCCCQLARHHDEERSQSSSGACQPLTNGTGGASMLAAIRSLSGEQADFEQRRSSYCSMLSAGAGDLKSAQIVI